MNSLSANVTQATATTRDYLTIRIHKTCGIDGARVAKDFLDDLERSSGPPLRFLIRRWDEDEKIFEIRDLSKQLRAPNVSADQVDGALRDQVRWGISAETIEAGVVLARLYQISPSSSAPTPNLSVANLPPALYMPGGEFKTVAGHRSIVGTVMMDGRPLETLISFGSFGKSKQDQEATAHGLGYRLATPEENRSYANGLIKLEASSLLSDPDWLALETYRNNYLRDTSNAVYASRTSADSHNGFYGGNHALPKYGALFVREPG
jgi:hypothetical protein